MYAEAIAAGILAVLSIYDIRYRELPGWLVFAGLAITVAVRIVEGIPLTGRLLFVYLLFDIIVIATMSITAFLELIGWGDVLAVAIIAAASPTPSMRVEVIPPLITTISYYAIVVLILALGNLAYNIMFSRRYLTRLPARYKVIYMLIARPIRAEDFLRGRTKWWYPLNMCGEYRVTFNIYMDPPDVRREVEKAVSKGCVKPGEVLWSSYGLPMLPLLFVGYILSLLVGDKVFIHLLELT